MFNVQCSNGGVQQPHKGKSHKCATAMGLWANMSSLDSLQWSNKIQTNKGKIKQRINPGPQNRRSTKNLYEMIGRTKMSLGWTGWLAAGVPKSSTYGRSSHQSVSGDMSPGESNRQIISGRTYFDRYSWGEIGPMVVTTATTFVASSQFSGQKNGSQFLDYGSECWFQLVKSLCRKPCIPLLYGLCLWHFTPTKKKPHLRRFDDCRSRRLCSLSPKELFLNSLEASQDFQRLWTRWIRVFSHQTNRRLEAQLPVKLIWAMKKKTLVGWVI